MKPPAAAGYFPKSAHAPAALGPTGASSGIVAGGRCLLQRIQRIVGSCLLFQQFYHLCGEFREPCGQGFCVAVQGLLRVWNLGQQFGTIALLTGIRPFVAGLGVGFPAATVC